MENPVNQDHRRLERFAVQLPATISTSGSALDQNVLALQTVDISSSGAFFQTASPMPVGSEVKIELVVDLEKLRQMSGQHARIQVSGYVVRVKENGMAVCFDEEYQILPVTEKKTGS